MKETNEQITNIIEENYELGKVVELQEIFGGYTSRAFRAVMEKNGGQKSWFFRKYLKPKPESEVLFEHNLLLYAKKNGFTKGAVPIAARNGLTFVSKSYDEAGCMRQIYYTLYEYLQGEEPYDWITNIMPQKSYLGIASTVAELHNAAFDFDPCGNNGSEPPILEFIKELPVKFRFYYDGCVAAGMKNCYMDYLGRKLGYLTETAEQLAHVEIDANRLPVIPIQCDVHPGNFKFIGAECVGMFDFEAAKMDIRLFELALGVFNCFSSWQKSSDAVIHLNKAKEFLCAYDARLIELKSGLALLTEEETRHFSSALQLSNMYMAQWCLRVYYTDMTNDPDEYFWYLRHMVRSIEWVDEHKDEINKMAGKL